MYVSGGSAITTLRKDTSNRRWRHLREKIITMVICRAHGKVSDYTLDYLRMPTFLLLYTTFLVGGLLKRILDNIRFRTLRTYAMTAK